MLSRLPLSLCLSACTYEGVDRLETSLHGLVHGFPGDDAWRFQLDSGTLVGLHGALTVDSVSEGVNDSAKHALADGHIDDRASPLDDVALLDLSAHVRKVIKVRVSCLAAIRRLLSEICCTAAATYLSLPKMTIPTLSVSKLRAIPLTPDLNSTISPACTLVRPKTLAIPSPIEMTEPNSLRSFYSQQEHIRRR